MWITVKFILFVFIIPGDDASSQVPGVLLLDGRTVEGLVGRAEVNCENYDGPSKCAAANCKFCCETWKCSRVLPRDCATGCPSYCADEEKCWKYGCHYDRKNWKCSKRNTCKNNNTKVVFAVNLCGESVVDQAGIWYQKDEPSQFHPLNDDCYEREDRDFDIDPSLYQTQYWPPASTGLLFIPIWEDGHYQLNMKFAELYAPNLVHRIFSITLNNQPLVTELDVYPWKNDVHQEVHNFYIKDMKISVKGSRFLSRIRWNKLEIRFIFHDDKQAAAGGRITTNHCIMNALYVRRIGDATTVP